MILNWIVGKIWLFFPISSILCSLDRYSGGSNSRMMEAFIQFVGSTKSRLVSLIRMDRKPVYTACIYILGPL